MGPEINFANLLVTLIFVPKINDVEPESKTPNIFMDQIPQFVDTRVIFKLKSQIHR